MALDHKPSPAIWSAADEAKQLRALLREAIPYLQSLERLVNNNRSLSMPQLPHFIYLAQCAVDRRQP